MLQSKPLYSSRLLLPSALPTKQNCVPVIDVSGIRLGSQPDPCSSVFFAHTKLKKLRFNIPPSNLIVVHDIERVPLVGLTQQRLDALPAKIAGEPLRHRRKSLLQRLRERHTCLVWQPFEPEVDVKTPTFCFLKRVKAP